MSKTAASKRVQRRDADLQPLRDKVLDLINSELASRIISLNQNGNAEIIALVPLPDSEVVGSQSASPEQWEKSIIWILESALTESAARIDETVQLLFSHAV